MKAPSAVQRILLGAAVLSLTLPSSVTFSQIKPTNLSAKGQADYRTYQKVFSDEQASNGWQLTIVDPSTEKDTVSPELRIKRSLAMSAALTTDDMQWRRLMKLGAIDVPEGDVDRPLELSQGSHISKVVREFYPTPGAVWLVGTFESFHEYRADSHKGHIYTEEDYRIEEVVQAPPSTPIAKGDLLSYETPTGCFRLPNGDVEARRLTALTSSTQPGQRYLMQATFDPDLRLIVIKAFWLIKSDRVYAATPKSQYLASQGKSPFHDVPLSQAEAYIKSLPAPSQH